MESPMDGFADQYQPVNINKDDEGFLAAARGSTAPQRNRGLRIAFLMVCLVGVLLSADLLRLHFRVHADPNYHAFCAVSEYVDCERVAFSSYAVFAGLPVALWGIIGYLFMGGLCISGLRPVVRPVSWPFGMAFWLGLISFLISLMMFAISHFLIRSLCLVCSATYIVNLVLVILALAELRRLKQGPLRSLRPELNRLKSIKLPVFFYVIGFVAALVLLGRFLPAYWHVESATGPGGLPVGTTTDGRPWIGARRPVLEIVEFSDYQCPFCARGQMDVRALISNNSAKIRLVHRHFPLRRHSYAFEYAKLAVCAGRQHRFWEANDYLFAHGRRPGPITSAELAGALDIDLSALEVCLAGEDVRQEVTDDIAAGRSLGVRATPTFIIGDESYPGRIPAAVISERLAGK